MIDKIKKQIIAVFGVSEEKAEKYTKDLIDQIEKHGGNLQNEEEVNRSIKVIVGKWIQKGY